MNQVTKKQHYIWRNYLASWTNNGSNTGRIMCLRDNKIFTVSLMKIAHENYFYGINELSKQERTLIYEMAINNVTGRQKEANERWLDLYCAPFDLMDNIVQFRYSIGYPINSTQIKDNQEFKNWNIEHIEKVHCIIESMGMKYMELIKNKDLSFWNTEKGRDEFSFFLCNQYFRTKRTRDSIITVFEKCKSTHGYFKDIHPENMWLPLSLIYASNVGANIAHNYSAVLLQIEKGGFVVGDQPVINIHSTFDMLTTPDDVELFYPITPHTALFLTKAPRYKSGQTVKIGVNEAEKYNALEVNASIEQVFAIDDSQLGAYISDRNL